MRKPYIIIGELKNAFCDANIDSIFDRNIDESLLKFYQSGSPDDKDKMKRIEGFEKKIPQGSNNIDSSLANNIYNMMVDINNIISKRSSDSKALIKMTHTGEAYDPEHRVLREIQELLLIMRKSCIDKDMQLMKNVRYMAISLKKFVSNIIERNIFGNDDKYKYSINKSLFGLIEPLEQLIFKTEYKIRRCSSEQLLGHISSEIRISQDLLADFCLLIANFQEQLSDMSMNNDKEPTKLSGLIRFIVQDWPMSSENSNRETNSTLSEYLHNLIIINKKDSSLVPNLGPKYEINRSAINFINSYSGGKDEKARLDKIRSGMSPFFEESKFCKLNMLEIMGWFQQYKILVKKIASWDKIGKDLGELGLMGAIGEYIDSICSAEEKVRAIIIERCEALYKMALGECMNHNQEFLYRRNLSKAHSKLESFNHKLRGISSNLGGVRQNLKEMVSRLPKIEEENRKFCMESLGIARELDSMIGSEGCKYLESIITGTKGRVTELLTQKSLSQTTTLVPDSQ